MPVPISSNDSPIIDVSGLVTIDSEENIGVEQPELWASIGVQYDELDPSSVDNSTDAVPLFSIDVAGAEWLLVTL